MSSIPQRNPPGVAIGFQLHQIPSPFITKTLRLNIRGHQSIKQPVFHPLSILSSSTSLSPPTTVTEAVPSLTPDAEDDEIGAWIPLGSQKALSDLGPTSVTIMGHRLVVFEGKGGKWSALDDACSHKLAPLSQGRYDEDSGCIECPYHGWQFDTEGVIRKVPQLDVERQSMDKLSSGLNVKSYPVHAAGDLLFVFLPSSMHGEMFLKSELPEHRYPYLQRDIDRNITYYTREVPYSWDFLVENFMDPAHIPFAHHGLQGVRNDGSDIPMKVLVNNFTHLELKFDDIVRGKERDAVMSFQRPTYYHFRTRSSTSDEYEPSLMIHTIPVTAGRSRVIFGEFFSKMPAWLQHGFSNRFLNTDTWLHDTERMLRLSEKGEHDDKRGLAGYALVTNSDQSTRAYRRWWIEHNMAKAPSNTFGPATKTQLSMTPQLTRRQQIDPWEYHTKTCSSCRKALTNFKKIQKAGLILTTLSLALLRRKKVLSTALSLTGLAVYYVCKKIVTFIEGNPYPSGVADRSVAALKN
eukprot:CAMPEP_0172484854 /NCGR_PEP_ID=MMETSP1066-20121228/12498_1 /TAXON_ID=671091 /ORGANISM="Coscinodiscus wailesii, Strain CCMP2513" /LENGTH=520 /DNA_ID=CAMNT_0013249653 /DNA_START=1 /DNA_END=1563 /DNA_ORIENTATION=+